MQLSLINNVINELTHHRQLIIHSFSMIVKLFLERIFWPWRQKDAINFAADCQVGYSRPDFELTEGRMGLEKVLLATIDAIKNEFQPHFFLWFILIVLKWQRLGGESWSLKRRPHFSASLCLPLFQQWNLMKQNERVNKTSQLERAMEQATYRRRFRCQRVGRGAETVVFHLGRGQGDGVNFIHLGRGNRRNNHGCLETLSWVVGNGRGAGKWMSANGAGCRFLSVPRCCTGGAASTPVGGVTSGAVLFEHFPSAPSAVLLRFRSFLSPSQWFQYHSTAIPLPFQCYSSAFPIQLRWNQRVGGWRVDWLVRRSFIFGWRFWRPSRLSAVSEQSQCALRRALSRFWFPCRFRAVSVPFPRRFRTVSLWFQWNFRAVSEQLWSDSFRTAPSAEQLQGNIITLLGAISPAHQCRFSAPVLRNRERPR